MFAGFSGYNLVMLKSIPGLWCLVEVNDWNGDSTGMNKFISSSEVESVTCPLLPDKYAQGSVRVCS